ncbi:unnamed protein product [Camellia sinensis]
MIRERGTNVGVVVVVGLYADIDEADCGFVVVDGMNVVFCGG